MRRNWKHLLLVAAFAASLPARLTAADAPRTTIGPDSDGVIRLHAREAIVHGTMLRYEPQTNKNCLGYWTKAEDWAHWDFTVPQPGEFAVEVWQGCGQGQGGSEVNIELGGGTLPFIVEDTGHFQNFKPRRLGSVTLNAGTNTLAVKPQMKKAAAVMDIREIRLVPKVPTGMASPPRTNLP